MDNSIYEVDRDDYAGFIGQLNRSMCEVENFKQDDISIIKIISKNTKSHLCTRIITQDGEEHYYIFNMPEANERIEPKPIMKVSLDTKEEVQAFFDAISKLQKEARKNAGTI